MDIEEEGLAGGDMREPSGGERDSDREGRKRTEHADGKEIFIFSG